MKTDKVSKQYFSRTELIIWGLSVTMVALGFLIFDRSNYLAFLASLIGVSALIFISKGNPIGQVLTIAFSILYGIISYSYAYYGEMITYLGMTGPMAVLALISWLRNPYKGNKSEVEVNSLKSKEYYFLAILATAVTVGFYFILKFFNTQNLIPSTVSVATSFVATYLIFRRSPYYAIAYALNDVVLIVLWTLACIEDTSYISVNICFMMFLLNDVYGFINWSRMKKRQQALG